MKQTTILIYGHYSIKRKNTNIILCFQHPDGIRLDGIVPVDLTSSGMFLYDLQKRPKNSEHIISKETATQIFTLADQLSENKAKHSKHDRANPESLHKQVLFDSFQYQSLTCFVRDNDHALYQMLSSLVKTFNISENL